MPYCHQTSSGDWMLLYTRGQNILLRVIDQKGLRQPLFLASDFHSDLGSVQIHDQIYYSYMDQNAILQVFLLGQKSSIYRTSAESNGFRPMLLTHQGDLMLLYLSPKESETLCLQATLPLTENATYCFPEKISKKSSVFLQKTEDDDCLFYYCADQFISRFHFTKESGFWKESNPLEHTLEKLTSENHDLRQMLEQAKTQYKELMDVAYQYRAEAGKWYQKCIRK